jgi:hypothetical protein
MNFKYKYEDVQWDTISSDTVEKIKALQACWKSTEEKQPELHKKLVAELYAPALLKLAEFCSIVKIS